MEKLDIITIILTALFLGLGSFIFRGKPEEDVFKSLKLFPNWMKLLGFIIVLLSFVLPWTLGLLHDGKNLIGIQAGNIGLFVICFSRDKQEDEMTNQIRLKSFYRSVMGGFLYLFLMNAIEVIWGASFYDPGAWGIMFIILFFYLIHFSVTKSKIRSAE